jgi:transforming growth factor-beta-induced protein
MVNKKLFSVILATLVTVGMVGGASVAFAQVTVTQTTQTVVQKAEATPTLSELVKALNATNLTATLNDTTKNFTVFAPDNAAFAKLGNATLNDLLTNNTTKLAAILKDHVVVGKVNLTTNGSAQTLAGDTIAWTVNGTKTQVQLGDSSANVTTANVNTTNGQVNIIDAVLTPPAGATGAATASATAAGGFLGLPGFEAVYGVAGLLAVAYLILRRRK